MKKVFVLAVLASLFLATVSEAGLFNRRCGNSRGGLFQRLRGGGLLHRHCGG